MYVYKFVVNEEYLILFDFWFIRNKFNFQGWLSEIMNTLIKYRFDFDRQHH